MASEMRFAGLPAWVRDGFVKDEMAVQMIVFGGGRPFLRTGMAPEIGAQSRRTAGRRHTRLFRASAPGGAPMHRIASPAPAGQQLYLQINYEHDGSHPEYYRGWERMSGTVTQVRRRLAGGREPARRAGRLSAGCAAHGLQRCGGARQPPTAARR